MRPGHTSLLFALTLAWTQVATAEDGRAVTLNPGQAVAAEAGLTGPEGLQAFRNALEAIMPGWRVEGERIVGPEEAEVRLARRHTPEFSGHVDVLFVLDAKAAGAGELWDCVAGVGPTLEERAQTAARIWSQTTASALLEWKYSMRGRFADHLRGAEPKGFRGWHVISGAILGYGRGDSPVTLQRWLIEHPVLPRLVAALSPDVAGTPGPHGVKILFGGRDVAEVRLDGAVHRAATEVLLGLPWPRLEPFGVVRTYVILLAPEP